MSNWWMLALIAILAWGVVGYLQKISAALLHPSALLFWVVVGLIGGAACLAAAFPVDHMRMSAALLILGVGAGATNAAGTWCLFRALERGAPAALAIPLTALYPLITVALAVIVLHEAVTAREVVGAVLAITGGALLSYERPT